VVLPQYGDGGGRERDRAPSVPGLRRPEYEPAALGLLKRLLDSERGTVEIDILPTQCQELAPAQTGRECRRHDRIDRLAAQRLKTVFTWAGLRISISFAFARGASTMPATLRATTPHCVACLSIVLMTRCICSRVRGARPSRAIAA